VRVKKDDKFVLVGIYPGYWKTSGYSWLLGPEYFGELYHEACYLESLVKHESKRNNRAEEFSKKSQQTKEEQPSPGRRRLVR